jgi:aminoglycoside phosphotransferase (APT) family kinase protein
MSRRLDIYCWNAAVARVLQATDKYRSVKVSSLQKLGSGLTHTSYVIRTEPTLSPKLVLRVIDGVNRVPPTDEAKFRLECEAETLRCLERVGFATPVPMFVGTVDDEDLFGIVTTFVPGCSLQEFKRPNTLDAIAESAALVHHLPCDQFTHLSTVPKRSAHVLNELEALDACVFEFPEAVDAREWVLNHLPDDACIPCVLHGDLCPQNLHLRLGSCDMNETVGIIDWEFARIGDPAHDLAIVSRGTRKVAGQANGLKKLLNKYRDAGGHEFPINDVWVHEVLLAIGFLEQSLLDPENSGAPARTNADFLAGLLRRIVARIARS